MIMRILDIAKQWIIYSLAILFNQNNFLSFSLPCLDYASMHTVLHIATILMHYSIVIMVL